MGASCERSVARGEAGPDSDVDVVIHVPLDRKLSLLDLGELQDQPCELLAAMSVSWSTTTCARIRRRIAEARIEVFCRVPAESL